MWRLSGSWLWTTAQPWIVFGRPATSFEPSASGNSQIARCDGTVGPSQSQAHSDTYPDNKIVLYMLLAGLPMAYDTPYWRLQAPRHRHDTSHDPRTGDSGFPFRSVLLVTCKDLFRVAPSESEASMVYRPQAVVDQMITPNSYPKKNGVGGGWRFVTSQGQCATIRTFER